MVKWVATPDSVVKNMLEMAQVRSDDVVYDLGCGDGRVLIAAVEQFGVRKAIGYELRDDLYQALIKEIRKRNLQDKVTIFNDNLYNANLSEASVVTLYLSSEANELLRPKLEEELNNGTRVVSITFKIGNWQTSQFSLSGFLPYFPRRPAGHLGSPYYPIYLYVIPDAFNHGM